MSLELPQPATTRATSRTSGRASFFTGSDKTARAYPNSRRRLPAAALRLGGGSVFDLEILGQGRKQRQRDAQSHRDPADVSPGRIDAAGLDVGDPGRVDVGPQPEGFLAQVDLHP